MSQSSAKTLQRSAPHLAASSSTLIDADNVSVKLGTETVLQDVSMCVHTGEFIGVIGPNGAGKTTLIRTFLGLIVPTKGTIKKIAKNIGYIPQRGAMYSGQIPLSVLEVVALGSRGNKTKALEALTLVRIHDLASKRFTELSGGQQQRVAIAKALAGNPNLLVLDEPTTGIDEHSQTEFYDILAGLQQRGITILMISHDVDTVLRLVTRVVCLNRTVLYDGPPEHFEADKYLPQFYKAQHRRLHHHHGATHA